MVNDAEKYKEEDERAKARVDKKNELESYIFQCKNSLEQENIKDKLSEDETNDISDKSEEIQNRLDDNQDADLETLESWMKELQDVVNPIMTRMYQGSGGTPSDSKVPEGMSSDGPSVEEVD